MKKHSNQDKKKTLTAQNCQVSNFYLEALWNSLFSNCESLHNLFVVFQDLLHRKFDFLFIWKLKAKCSRVSQADLSPLSLCMGEGRFFAHFTFCIFICIVHFYFAFCISNFAFAVCVFTFFAFYILRFAFASWPHDTSTTPPFDCLMIYIIWYKPPLSSGKKYIVQFIRILPNASDNLSSPLGGSQPAAESDKW